MTLKNLKTAAIPFPVHITIAETGEWFYDCNTYDKLVSSYINAKELKTTEEGGDFDTYNVFDSKGNLFCTIEPEAIYTHNA